MAARRAEVHREERDVQALAASVPDSGGVTVVPAFTGLGAPYWDTEARGTITGLTRGSTVAHIARAAVESIAYQSAALLQAMQADAKAMGAPPLTELRVDGGASVNDALMQFQADLLGVPVVRPKVVETTALGAAYLAGLATGSTPGATNWRRSGRSSAASRRAERLFQIVQLIRGRRLSTARFLAERLEVSERTVYRDVADLLAQGVPIEGEAGVGYRMRAGFDLPPLMFTTDEARALVAAVRLAQPRLDTALAAQAEGALSKILAVLPAPARAAAESLAIYAPPVGPDTATRERLQGLREAAEARRVVRLRYLDLKGRVSERRVRPLGCFYWSEVWTLAAWCEVREDFRNFRVDRIERLDRLEESFRDEPGKTLADMFRQVEGEMTERDRSTDA
jgi:predicted DNA-binding transcriptional regulator YafY